MTYKQTKNEQGQVRNDQIQRIADGAYIPFDEANTDYQAFLLWKSQGNEPLPAENE